MPECKYGQCRMVNLCKTHCVRASLERDGWVLGNDNQLVKKAPLTLPEPKAGGASTCAQK